MFFQERDTSVSNMEYLKNVVYKFVTLPPCDERVHLVPVIDMMLKLNPDEKKTLQTLALGKFAHFVCFIQDISVAIATG